MLFRHNKMHFVVFYPNFILWFWQDHVFLYFCLRFINYSFHRHNCLFLCCFRYYRISSPDIRGTFSGNSFFAVCIKKCSDNIGAKNCFRKVNNRPAKRFCDLISSESGKNIACGNPYQTKYKNYRSPLLRVIEHTEFFLQLSHWNTPTLFQTLPS